MAIASITADVVRTMVDYKAVEAQKRAVKPPMPIINARDWPATVDAITEYLRAVPGSTGVPLAYVIRVDENILMGADPLNVYETIEDEMIAHAPHRDGQGNYLQSYLTDRASVWDVLNTMCRELTSATYIKPAACTHDGRMAYKGLHDHYLGPNNVDVMATEAEKKLATASYRGEQKRWNFERYASLHAEQHLVLNGLRRFDYAGIDERSKVRHLLNGIKSSALDAVKTQIMANHSLRNDFNACVSLYKEFIAQMATEQPKEMLVAALATGRFNKRVNKDVTVEDRYYSKEEYAKLTHDQRAVLAEHRKKRGKKPRVGGHKGQGDRSGKSRNVSVVVAATNQAAVADKQHSDSSIVDNDNASKRITNQTNKALTCQSN
jgi:hypothetical protein